MYLILFLLLLLALGLGLFVLAPLFQAPSTAALAASALEDETEFRRMIRVRDGLIWKLKGKEVRALPELAKLNAEQALEALVGICRSLKRLGLAPLPKELPPPESLEAGLAPTTEKGDESSSESSTSHGLPSSLLLLGLGASVLLGLLNPKIAHAQQGMPGLSVGADGIATAQVHQFVLSPAQGELRVYYMTLFSSESAEPVKLRIPSPTGATDFDFSSLPNALFSPDPASGAPLLEFTSSPGMNQVQGLFTLPAFSGAVDWRSETLDTLPGVVLIILPEYTNLLSGLFGETFTRLGVWPPRITSHSAELELKRTADPPAERDPNFKRLKRPPTQHSFHLFRRGDTDSPYPRFEIRGVVANRLPGHVLVATFGALLAGFSLLLALHPSFAKRPKAPSVAEKAA